VRVCCEEVDPAVSEQRMRHLLSSFAHVAEDGTGGDLNEHAFA